MNTRYDELGHKLKVGDWIEYNKKYKGYQFTPYGEIEGIDEDGKISILHQGYRYFPDEFKNKEEVHKVASKAIKPRVELKAKMKVFKVVKTM